MNEILIQILLGFIQGVTEWIPVSSSGVLTFVMTTFFNQNNLDFLVRQLLFLHLGTFFAALIYFRKEVAELFVTLFNYGSSPESTQKVLKFLVISTVISGIIGIILLKFLIVLLTEMQQYMTQKIIVFAVGIFLVLTAVYQIKVSKASGIKIEKDLTFFDAVLLGGAQGLAALPGLSRSGMTVSTLLIRKFNDSTALRLSFLMSMPIVLAGNILLNFNDLAFTSSSLYAVAASFVFGILTIHGLMKLAKKVRFGWFVLFFAILMMLSVLF